MQLVLLASDQQKEELLDRGISQDAELIWIDRVEAFEEYEHADACFDLQFVNDHNRINLLQRIVKAPVIVHSVNATISEINAPFIRINAWPGFLRRPIIEASCTNQQLKTSAEKIFSLLNRKTYWIADIPGFITARVVAMIINEAWIGLDEKISTKEEIDTAMKHGTNYPYGPFEWGAMIGLRDVHALLDHLSKTQPRYRPADLLKKQLVE